MSTKKKFYLAKSNQEGGTIENDFKEFSKYLMELIGATTDEELQNFVKEQGPEKVNEIYKQWKKQVPMAKDGMQFVSKTAAKSQSALVPGNIAIQNKIQDTAQDDLRGISSFKEAFAEARRRGLRQFSWGKGSYTTELAKPSSGGGGDNKGDNKGDSGDKGGGNTNREVPDSLKRRDTSVESEGESTATKTATKPAGNRGGSTSTAATTPTPIQPSNDLSLLEELRNLSPEQWGIIGGVAGATIAGGAGVMYGADKYYKNKAAKRRAARASASSTPSAPKPSIFRNLGDNAKEYLSKVPFKEKVNEYTSKAANLFKRTSAPATTAAPPSAPAEPTFTFKWDDDPKPTTKPVRTPRVKVRAGAVPRMLTAPPPAINPLSTDRWWQWKYNAPAAEPTTKPAAAPPKNSSLLKVPSNITHESQWTGSRSGGKYATFRWEGWKYGVPAVESAPGLPAGTGTSASPAPARTPRVKARTGAMARTSTAPPAAPPSAPAGSTFKWGGWNYDDALKPEGTTPKPAGTTIKPKAATAPKPKATAPKPGGKSGGKSGKSLKPGKTSTLAGKMAGKMGVLGMALGTISDLFPSKEAVELDRDAWEVSKKFGINRDEVTINDVDHYRRMKESFKEGGKMNKLDYINRLNGECPEGYTAVKFAKGGVICTTCQKNKEVATKKKNHLDAIKEEMKCGGKMKSHQNGGEMTNAQYKKAPLSKKVDQDLRDQAAGKNAGEGGTPKTDLAKSAPKKLIKKPTKK